MPGLKAWRKWLCTRSGLCQLSLGGQGTSVLSVADFAVNAATACYPAFTRSYRASVRPASYWFPRRPLLGNRVNRGIPSSLVLLFNSMWAWSATGGSHKHTRRARVRRRRYRYRAHDLLQRRRHRHRHNPPCPGPKGSPGTRKLRGCRTTKRPTRTLAQPL